MPEPSLPLAVICSSLPCSLLQAAFLGGCQFGLLAGVFSVLCLLFGGGACGGLRGDPFTLGLFRLALFVRRLALGFGRFRPLFGLLCLGGLLFGDALGGGFGGDAVALGLLSPLLGFLRLAFGFGRPGLLLGFLRPGAAFVLFALPGRGGFGGQNPRLLGGLGLAGATLVVLALLLPPQAQPCAIRPDAGPPRQPCAPPPAQCGPAPRAPAQPCSAHRRASAPRSPVANPGNA